jgi:hypothetical protein
MQFRALTDLYLNNGVYVQAGTTFEAPAGWVPAANAVDPVTPDAVQAYWNAGPAGCLDAEWRRALFTNCSRWSDVPVAPPATQWLPANPQNPTAGFMLGGRFGGNLGVHPIV